MRSRQYYKSFSRSRSPPFDFEFESEKVNNKERRKKSHSIKRNQQNIQNEINNFQKMNDDEYENKCKESFSKSLLTFIDAICIDSLNSLNSLNDEIKNGIILNSEDVPVEFENILLPKLELKCMKRFSKIKETSEHYSPFQHYYDIVKKRNTKTNPIDLCKIDSIIKIVDETNIHEIKKNKYFEIYSVQPQASKFKLKIKSKHLINNSKFTPLYRIHFEINTQIQLINLSNFNKNDLFKLIFILYFMIKYFLFGATKISDININSTFTFTKVIFILMINQEVSFDLFSLENIFNEFLNICEEIDYENSMTNKQNAGIIESGSGSGSLIPENNPLYYILKNGRVTLNLNSRGYELKLLVLNNKFVDEKILLMKQKADILYSVSKLKENNNQTKINFNLKIKNKEVTKENKNLVNNAPNSNNKLTTFSNNKKPPQIIKLGELESGFGEIEKNLAIIKNFLKDQPSKVSVTQPKLKIE